MIIWIFILAVFFALNMGGATFAASFAAPYGGKLLNRFQAFLLFLIFVILGSVLFGQFVTKTLSQNIVAPEILTQTSLIVILMGAGLSLFVANMMNIPQSTSLVTVAAIAGVGAFYGKLNVASLLYMLPFWIGLPIASFFLTIILTKPVYPPRKSNFWIYEKFVHQKKKLGAFVILSGCYNAFSVGTNNVPNVVGPMLGAELIDIKPALLLFSIVYGLGAIIFAGPIVTAGQKVVPLGLFTASIISFICGTLMLIASYLGIPQSFVMLKMGAIFGISSLKNGAEATFSNRLTKTTLYTWTINPILTFIFTYCVIYFIERHI